MNVNISVTIGRNVGKVPMDSKRWKEYKKGVHGVLQAFGFSLTSEETGSSHYITADGPVEEQHYRWWAEGSNEQTCGLRDVLGVLAEAFGQWGIHYSEGVS